MAEIQKAAYVPPLTPPKDVLVTELRKEDVPEQNAASRALPPQGHERREILKMRSDSLQSLIEQRGEQIAYGLLDESKMIIDPEIARYYADILHVVNPQHNRQYTWVECGLRDDQPQHAHRAQMLGYQFVGSDDPECPSTPRSPQGHRRIGTVVLMWIDMEKWIEIRAIEHAAALRQRGDLHNADSMLEVASRHGAHVRVIENWSQLSPESRSLAEQRFAQRQRELQQAKARIDTQLREGTAHLNYGNKRHAMI